MTSSAIPAVKLALKNLLDGATGTGGTLQGVLVSWGVASPPSDDTIEIYTSRTRREYAGIGNQPTRLDEDITVRVVVSVVRTQNEGPQVAEDRMWAVVEAVENLFRANMKLGGAWLYGRISEIDQEPITFDRKRGSRATLTFAGKARI